MSNTTTTQPNDDMQPARRKKRPGPVVGLAITGVMIFAFGISVGSAGKSSTAAGSTPTATVTKTVETPGPTTTVTAPAPVPPPPPGPATTISESGIYVVGVDIAAGKYKTTEGGGYFAILKDPTAPTDDVANILTNDNPRGQAFVTLKAGQGFETTGSMTWVKVD